jgi:hypothetical protein
MPHESLKSTVYNTLVKTYSRIWFTNMVSKQYFSKQTNVSF